MEYQQITFDEVKLLIGDILDYRPTENYNLTPNEIFCVVEETGIILEGQEIPNWSDFESGKVKIAIDEISNTLKIDLETEDFLIIISDECFRDQKALKIQTNLLKEFAEQTYPELYKIDLIQPLDLIFIQPSTKSISMIHHEGTIMEY